MTALKYDRLKEILRGCGRLAVAFSGGVDSAFLLAAAQEVFGSDLLAIRAEAPLFPETERTGAAAFCQSAGIRQVVFSYPALQSEDFCQNPPDRCYICKRALFSQMLTVAAEYGFPLLADGTNADDTNDYRPGMRALPELGIVSPLLEAGLTKAEIRQLSRSMGLPTWNHPSAACLASRIPYGERITAEKLRMIELAERHLTAAGFGQVRVRLHGTLARIEVSQDQFQRLLANRKQISNELKSYGFTYITLDMDGYRTGSMNEIL